MAVDREIRKNKTRKDLEILSLMLPVENADNGANWPKDTFR